MARTREGKLRYLVATDVAARGIDISHLTHVINYTFPDASEQYMHRTGRTGRAGRTGTAIWLVSPRELGSIYYLRLGYKIFPVERSLPTRGEARTRAEVDRVALLDEAFAVESEDELERAVARRLLAHPAAERLVGGLLRAFFGGRADVDEEAAAARRSRAPAPIASAEEAEPVREAREATAPRRSRRRSRSDETAEPPALEAVRDKEPERGRDSDDAEDEGEDGMTRLFVNVGRRDGLRAGDIARLFREATDLTRAEIGRIRVRDKHSFVDVAHERVDQVLSALPGRTVQDRELVVERAKVGS